MDVSSMNMGGASATMSSSTELVATPLPTLPAAANGPMSTIETTHSTPMAGMANSFHFGVGDTLWTSTLTPKTKEGYAGVIVLLILMAILLRFLIVATTAAGRYLKSREQNRGSIWSISELNEHVMPKPPGGFTERNIMFSRKWKAIIDIPRAVFQLFIATLVYLLLVNCILIHVNDFAATSS
jgi:hypothetical protein